jgi:hypothetical protein
MIDEPLWRQLEQSHPDNTGTVRRRIHSDPAFDIFAAVAQAGARRLVIVAVDAGVDIPQLPQTASIATTQLPGVGGNVEVRVMLLNDDMKPVFTPFAEDVLTAMSEATDGQTALDSLADRFEHWRNLLAGGLKGLGTSELIGLYGELWMLQNVCAPTLGIAESITSWKGPERERRDIVVGGLGIEVKATLTAPPSSVQIRSELQLDAAPLNHLVLVALEMDESAGTDGETVPELAGSLSAAAGPAASELANKLVRYGYHEMHVATYEKRRFLTRRLGIYKVDGDFPRIVPNALHPGIGEVRYRLNLGACEPWAIGPDELAGMISAATEDRREHR